MAKRKFRSGFCGNGQCEGTKPKSPSGKPLKTCEFWDTCQCDCHAQLTEMFAATDNERVAIQNPEWIPPRNHYWMPGLDDQSELSASPDKLSHTHTSPDSEVNGQSGTGSTSQAIVDLGKYSPTASGRKARGQLEDAVYRVLTEWLARTESSPQLFTPVVIAQAIDEKRPPSTGAIGAILDRWTERGFAMTAKKPVRFVGFATSLTLNEYKVKYSRKKRVEKSKQRRGIRA